MSLFNKFIKEFYILPNVAILYHWQNSTPCFFLSEWEILKVTISAYDSHYLREPSYWAIMASTSTYISHLDIESRNNINQQRNIRKNRVLPRHQRAKLNKYLISSNGDRTHNQSIFSNTLCPCATPLGLTYSYHRVLR